MRQKRFKNPHKSLTTMRTLDVLNRVEDNRSTDYAWAYRELRDAMWPNHAPADFPDGSEVDKRLLAAVRRMDLRRGDQ